MGGVAGQGLDLFIPFCSWGEFKAVERRVGDPISTFQNQALPPWGGSAGPVF